MFKKIAGRVVAVATVAAVTIGNAMAALPVEVTTAIGDAKTDGLAVAGGFLAASIVIAALLVARRGAKG